MPPTTMRYAGWLPPIHHRGGGWLPLKATSVAGIVDALAVVEPGSIQPGGTSNHCADLTRRRTLLRALSTDPALVVFTAARCSQQDNESLADDVSSRVGVCAPIKSLDDLVQWWLCHGRDAWRETDWLVAPESTSGDVSFAKFERLDDYFRVVPIRKWLKQSDPWFEAAGTSNPIPQSWKDVFETGAGGSNEVTASTDAHLTIDRLVRGGDELHVRGVALSEAVRTNKRDLAHRLAYGLSHEINNPLANISTRAQSLAHQVDEPAIQESLKRIVDQTSRAHAMIADLMFYANPPAVSLREFNLVARIETVVAAANETAERLGIEIDVMNSSGDDVLMINADEEMIGEAVGVLVRNSIEAIGVDGRIRIEVSVAEDTVQIAVADSGPGMTATQVEKAMDPYYSGREAGRGLGLGLCRADRIAGLHRGQLCLTPGLAGCVATLTLPR